MVSLWKEEAYIEPGSKHPDAMLVDLKSFDVDVGEDEGNGRNECYKADPDLCIQSSAKSYASGHYNDDLSQIYGLGAG